MTTGEKMNKLLENNNISQTMLAKKTGISVSSISLYLRDMRHPNSITLKKIADVLGTSVDYLADDTIFTDFQKLKHICIKNRRYWTTDQKIDLVLALFEKDEDPAPALSKKALLKEKRKLLTQLAEIEDGLKLFETQEEASSITPPEAPHQKGLVKTTGSA